MRKTTVLIVEDEAHIRDMVRLAISTDGYELLEAESAKEASRLLADKIPDLILLDWMLPGMSGIDYAKQLKQNTLTKNIPIIMLTAKAEEEHKIYGLDAGADDYIVKPFSPRELLARMKAVLRRGPLVTPENLIEIADMKIDVASHQVSIGDQNVTLSPMEYRLLYFFVTHQDRVYTREQLLDHVWGGDAFLDNRTVDVHIRRLRNMLKPFNYHHYIRTERGFGYQFVSKLA